MHLHRRTALAILFALTTAGLAACSSNNKPPATSGTTTMPASGPSTTTVSGAPTTVSLGNPAPPKDTSTTILQSTDNPNFLAAQKQWQQGACVASAVQGQYWQQAATDLSTIPPDATVVSDLKQLISLPDMGLTATQSSEYQNDVTALDSFFATPNLYGSSTGNCPS